jgi:hypothetical protein
MTTNLQPDAYALLESHFNAPLALRHYQSLPRRSDEHRNYSSTAAPLVLDTLRADDETESIFSSQQPTPLEPPAAVNGADSGLPPTPPTMSQDGQAAQATQPSPHADSVVNSLMSKKSSLSTPVNARSPPTPDPSPPRTHSSNAAPERPHLYAYPSSAAASFKTAREEASSEPSRSRSITPIDHRLSTVGEEDRGLGLAFETSENDMTPTDRVQPSYPPEIIEIEADTIVGAEEDKEAPVEEKIPDREWNTDLMRNVTVRRKRTPRSSPRKERDSHVDVTMVRNASPSPSPQPRTRRESGLRERVEKSTNSPVTPSIENFAQSIGWPSEERPVVEQKAMREVKDREESNKRNSTSSVASTRSTRVEANIIVTPPQRTQTLRHSGRNISLRDSSPTPDRTSRRRSNRDSSQNEDVPLHRLVHKKVTLADRSKRFSTDSTTLGTERSTSSPLSFRSRIIDSSAATLAHQESLRNVLQPAADILSRTSSVYHGSTRYVESTQSYHRRIGSAPEAARKSALSSAPRSYTPRSPPKIIQRAPVVTFQSEPEEHSPIQSPAPSMSSPRSLKRRQRSNVGDTRNPLDFNKTLPGIPREGSNESAEKDVFLGASAPVEEARPRSAMLDRVRQLLEEQNVRDKTPVSDAPEVPQSPEYVSAPSPPQEYEFSPPMKRGPRSLRGHSGDRRRSTPSQDRASTSPEVVIRPSLDRRSTEEMARPSFDWRRPSDNDGRVSFDRSTIRTEEHGSARHLFASTTPFSQFSDTPIEVSEATAVSIYPHNNHSLLVVQQGSSRVGSMTPEPRQLLDVPYPTNHDDDVRSTPTPPFVDASEEHSEEDEQQGQPTLTFEPSTPPMQIDLPQPGGVDSPLENPRPPPEPPQIITIPPTPMEELEKQLAPAPPGPPKRSDSHPQRRLSLVQRAGQRARRYSDNLLPTLISRATNGRGRYASDSHRHPQAPSVNSADENGALHPFWRPRGFWDGFEDDSESESEDELHPGGDTSDIETLPDPPKRSATLKKRLTGSIRGSGGFLIGNSLGMERHGTNKRRHHITLPPNFSRSPRTSPSSSSPKVLIQPPTMPLGAHGGGGIQKRQSLDKRGSMSSLRSFEENRRGSWRQGRSLPGLKKYQVQYIGLSGVKDKIRDKRQEKRREKLRQSIGARVYMPDASGT